MASLQQAKQRIDTSRAMVKITTVMQMVSVAKLHKHKVLAQHSEAYKNHVMECMGRILQESSIASVFRHMKHNKKKALVLTVSSDKGLCGILNTRLGKQTAEQIKGLQSSGYSVRMKHIGIQGKATFAHRIKDKSIKQEYVPNFYLRGKINPIALHEVTKAIIDSYYEAHISEFFIAFNKFKSLMSSEPIFINIKDALPKVEHNGSFCQVDCDADQIVKSAEYQAIYALVSYAANNNIACEHSLRMQAMDAATRNTNKIITQLTIYRNKTRQSSITAAIIDVVSAAQSGDAT